LLFYANKMDLPGAMTPDECMDELGLDKIRDKPWQIKPSNAVTGAGISDGVEWLCDNISGKNRK
jgi:hypothetical protein